MADVRNACFSVKSSPFSCRRDALDVNKKDRMEEIGTVRRESKGGRLFCQYHCCVLKYELALCSFFIKFPAFTLGFTRSSITTAGQRKCLKRNIYVFIYSLVSFCLVL